MQCHMYMIIRKCLKFPSHAQLIITAAVDQFSMISVFEIKICFKARNLNYGWRLTIHHLVGKGESELRNICSQAPRDNCCLIFS